MLPKATHPASMQVPSVLIVDDEPEILGLLQEAFTDQGWKVRAACHGREALAMLQEERFDAILSDLTMPEMDGVQLIRNAKGKGLNPHAPFFVLSGTLCQDTLRSIDELGVSQIMLKPFDPFSVVRKVKTNYLLDQGKTGKSSIDFDTEIMDAVVRSMQEVVAFYLGDRGHVGTPELKDQALARGYFTAQMPFHQKGTIASVAFTCDKNFLQKSFAAMFPGKPGTNWKDFAPDIAREMCNQIGGRMKNYLVRMGYEISLGIPQVTMGPGHKIIHAISGPVVLVPLESADCKICVEFTMSGKLVKSKKADDTIDLFGDDEEITFFF